MSVKIIAEIGVNHNGSMNLAKQLIDSGKTCGADTVKFQTFSTERLASRSTPKVPYQLRTSDAKESHFDMLKKLELSKEDHELLIDYCKKQDIEFCSTPYSREDAEFLDSLNVTLFKVASADIIDRPLHEFLASTKKECIIATGMATLAEIEETVSIYEEQGSREFVTLLQCVSAYPSDPADSNLRVMETLRSAFGCRVGLSDHSTGISVAIASIALGATVVEKHFTLDRSMEGPDHAASIIPEEFAELVDGIRSVEAALGDGIKKVCPGEMDMRRISRKSVIAAKELEEGHVVAELDLNVRRPGTGLSPMRYRELIGKRLRRTVSEGEQILLSEVE